MKKKISTVSPDTEWQAQDLVSIMRRGTYKNSIVECSLVVEKKIAFNEIIKENGHSTKKRSLKWSEGIRYSTEMNNQSKQSVLSKKIFHILWLKAFFIQKGVPNQRSDVYSTIICILQTTGWCWCLIKELISNCQIDWRHEASDYFNCSQRIQLWHQTWVIMSDCFFFVIITVLCNPIWWTIILFSTHWGKPTLQRNICDVLVISFPLQDQ